MYILCIYMVYIYVLEAFKSELQIFSKKSLLCVILFSVNRKLYEVTLDLGKVTRKPENITVGKRIWFSALPYKCGFC